MTTEQMFGQQLGLGKAWRVVEARLESGSSTFLLKVEETAALWLEESARSGSSVTCHDHVEQMQWRHLNVFNKECVNVCALPGGRSGDDGKVYHVTPPWEGRSKHFTQEFEALALTLMREMPIKRVGHILSESNSRMWRMLFAHVKAAHERLSFANVVWVGTGEMNRRKGQTYLTLFADLLAEGVRFATLGKDASVWKAFAAGLLHHNEHPKAIRRVAIDMSVTYTKGVSGNLENAQVVNNKFYVIQNVVEACDEVRKGESRSDDEKRELLERTLWLWIKNRMNWAKKKIHKWESMALERCVTGTAYEMRLVLHVIYQWRDAEVAKKMFGNWCAWVKAIRGQTGELLEPKARAARIIEGRLAGILAHWTHGLTTTYMKGLNSLLSAVRRKARGYRTVEYMTDIVYFDAGNLTLTCN